MEDTNNIDIKDNKQEDISPEWNTCCSHSSKDFIKYITTVSMSVIVLIFCIVMIYSNPENDNSIYFALLSSIISIYIPNPTLENTK
tara:strand:+ start:356 stop:613 length:258 start_codon:yes stop_codon:yes gene_type:complete